MKENFKELKKIYTDIEIPDYLIDKKWEEQQFLLPFQDTYRPTNRYYTYSAVFLSALLVLIVTTFSLALSSKPGSFLYPVNSLTQELAKQMSGTLLSEEKNVQTPKMHPVTNLQKRLPTPTVKPSITQSPHTTSPTKMHEKNSEHNSTVLGTQSEEVTRPTSTHSVTHENNSENSHNIQNDNGTNNHEENNHKNTSDKNQNNQKHKSGNKD